MQLSARGLPYEVPQYSLTGDIVAHHRCGLQYRYYNRSSLPPSRPVQLWTGEFVHGVMEEAFLYWRDIGQPPFPWPNNPTSLPGPATPLTRDAFDIGELGDKVEARLRATGKTPRSRNARDAAYRRVDAGVNVLGRHLFPLITAVEEKVSGTRPMPQLPSPPPAGQTLRGDRYELTGRVDVISSVSLGQHQGNPLVQLLQQQTTGLRGNFDVIVDYKAARRPPTQPKSNAKSLWRHEALQVQLYSWLRGQQPQANPVRGGILIYVNELAPSASEVSELLDELRSNRTDVAPMNGDPDYYALYGWRPGQPTPPLSEAFRLRRAVRVVPVGATDITKALANIDSEVADIELCALRENASGDIPTNWQATGDDQDCDACDFRRFCPAPSSVRNPGSGSAKPRNIEAPG